MEKTFARYSCDRKFTFRIYKELKKKWNTKITNNPINNWANDLNRHFSNKEIQMKEKYMKRCWPSLAMGEVKIKSTLRFSLMPPSPVRMAVIKNKHWQRCWRKKNSYSLLVGR
jgi:hypothetical protein